MPVHNKRLWNRWVVALLSAIGLAAAGSDLRLVDAAEKHDTEAVRTLLKQHVDVNAPQADGATALQWAAHWDDVDMANVLIRAGAHVNTANDYGVTPLLLACTNGSGTMVDALLKAGARVNVALPTGETPLMAAARSGNADIVKALASAADVNAREHTSGQTALMWAAAEVHPDVVRVLIENQADIHLRTAGGFTALLFAARGGDVESARLLLAAGADVNESAPDGSSALLVATASAQEAVALLLVEKGADPNLADSIGYTPLHAVVWKASAKAGLVRPNGTSTLVKALLAHGANPNVQITQDPPPLPGNYVYQAGLTGATPLWLAAKAADASVMRALVAGGADLRLGNKAGTTPLMVAAGLGRAQGPGGQPERRLLDAVKAAVELGADLDAVNDAGQTAMHGAAAQGFDSIIQFLADRGAKVNVKDTLGQTPLNAADRRNSVTGTTVQLLRTLSGEPESGRSNDDTSGARTKPGGQREK